MSAEILDEGEDVDGLIRNGAISRNIPVTPIGLDTPSQGDALITHHDRHFSTILADSPALLEAAHALRFQVYCLEHKFENAEEHPDGLEVDAYDEHAIQGVLFHGPTRGTIGTVRMIFPKKPSAEDSFPIMSLLRANSMDLSDYVDLTQCIEISRFAISKEFRRRKADQMDNSVIADANAGRDAHLAFLSLVRFVLRQSVRHNVVFWTAVMEPRLLRLLARLGICYTPVGPLVEYHGIRQPCHCYLPDMLENARRAQPRSWEVLTDGGVLHDQLASNIRKLAAA